MSTIRTLDFRDGPLVWVDCEMTGLDPRKDKILEIAVCATVNYLLLYLTTISTGSHYQRKS